MNFDHDSTYHNDVLHIAAAQQIPGTQMQSQKMCIKYTAPETKKISKETTV